jgi:putative ATP-binding cassette transporter
MRLVVFLLRSNGGKTSVVASLGLLSGIASAGLIAVVNAALHVSNSRFGSRSMMALVFFALMLVKIGGSVGSSLLLGRLSQEYVLDLCTTLCRRVIATPFRDLEEIGSSRILTCLTEDVAVLSASIQAIPPLLINLAVLGGCAVYLAWLSWASALLLLVLVAAIAFCYKLLAARAYEAILRSRKGRDKLTQHFRALTDGIKELQIHRGRREAFFREDVDAAAEYLRRENTTAMDRYALADGWGQAMFLLVLGTLLFVLPALNRITPEALTAYVLAAIYVMSPTWSIIGAVPGFNRGKASLQSLEELGIALKNSAGSFQNAVPPLELPRTPPLVELRKVVFKYSGKANGDGFTLGPLDVALHPGELIFIIGGNGSGKSTLVKLLTGLYTPDAGDILVDGQRVSVADQEHYRQLFSVVYSDFYLFDRLMGAAPQSNLGESTEKYLAALHLSHKVRIEGQSFSTTALSQGQRRRLALLSAYLEDRSIYVLDEWAADQDPAFREIFYHTLLPELKSRGKTVVVITHDDRYFRVGDRVIKLDYGRAVE